jgi:hypothetical protein
MSRLEFYARPLIAFDVSKAEHRKYYHDFVMHGTWGRCPYRFIVPDDHGNLITMIQRKLVEHYVDTEFSPKRKRVARKQQPVYTG